MTIRNGKFHSEDSARWEEVFVRVQAHIDSDITTWTGELRLSTGHALLGTEAGELLFPDGAKARIVLNGITAGSNVSRPLYKFLLTSPFSSA